MATGRPDYTGETVARLKGVNGTTPTDVQVDVDGNLTLNVKRQDLGYLTQRPMYGQAMAIGNTQNVTANACTTLVSISGKGMIYSGYVWWWNDYNPYIDNITLVIDGITLYGDSFKNLLDKGFILPGVNLYTVNKYDELNHKFTLSFQHGITFDASFEILYCEEYGYTPQVETMIRYTLME